MKKAHRIILIVLIIVFPALFIFQGIDLTDTGFFLTKISKFIEQESGGIAWFSYFIGYLWGQVFGESGLLGFKILSYIFYELTVWVVYFGFRIIFSRKYLLLYIFLGMMMTLSMKTFYFSYDNVSNLFLVLGATLMLTGTVRGSWTKIGLAGFVFALSTMSRLPDILSLGIIILFPLYEYLKHYSFRDLWGSRKLWLRSIGIFLAGFILGISAVLVLIHLFGQSSSYFEEVNKAFNIFVSNDGSDVGHSATGMVAMQMTAGRKMVNSALLFVVISLLFSWIIQNRSGLQRKMYYALFVIGITIFIFVRTDHDYFLNYVNIMTGSQFILALLFFWSFLQVESKYRLALLCGIAVMFFSFMGSDTGLLKSATGWFITVPALMLILDDIGDLNIRTGYLSGNRDLVVSASRMKYLLIYVILLASFMIRYVAVFGDEGKRHKIVHPMDIPLVKGNYTTKEKAHHVEVIFEDLNKYVQEDDFLVGIGGGPLFNYITGAKYYISRTWILWYPTEMIVKDLNEAYKKHNKLPVILIVDEEIFRTVYLSEKGLMKDQKFELYKFIESFQYNLVIAEDHYEIWVPADDPGR